MKSLVYEGPLQLTVTDMEIPACKEHELLVRVDAVGICGSELEGYLGHSSVRKPPLVMGHEFCGTVEQVGSMVTRVSAGDRVTVNPLVACRRCDKCRQGRTNVCRNRQIIGIHRPGAFAEYVAVPESNVYRVDPGAEPALLSLAEPLAVCVHALKIGYRPFESLMIYGAGPIGLLTLQAAQQMGAADVLVVDKQPNRLQYAEKLGAAVCGPEETRGAIAAVFGESGVDTIIDCVGAQATREQAVERINPGGTVVMVGLAQQISSMPMNDLVRQEVAVIGSYTYTDTDFEQALALLQDRRIQHGEWTVTRSLDDGPECFRLLSEGTAPAGKYILLP